MRRAILTEYLLSATHPEGRPKAGFFRRVGFGPENADALANALLQLARSEEVAEVAEAVDSPHGTKYTGNGVVEDPNGDPCEPPDGLDRGFRSADASLRDRVSRIGRGDQKDDRGA